MGADDNPGRSSRTPVHLLTGFLGSGKTTLLQRLLDSPDLAGTAVLINEFGEVALDHHLLTLIDETMVLLPSGCLCCTVRGELVEALIRLNSQRAAGSIPAFNRIVIETTGLADPFPAMSTLRAHPVLVHHFAFAGVVTTVDAVNISAQMQAYPEAMRQIAAADHLVLTKTDLVSEKAARDLQIRLAALNPSAVICCGADMISPADLLLSSVDRMGVRSGISKGHGDSEHGHIHRHGTEGTVQSFTLFPEGCVNWTGFGIWLTMLLHSHGARILRVKGILAIEGEDLPVAVHGVGRLVHPPSHMPTWPDDDRRSRIVFIVDGLDPERIRDSFTRFNRLADIATLTG